MKTSEPTSLLGGPFPAELEEKWAKEREQEQQQADKAGALRELLLEGYRSGDLSFEQYARLVQVVIRVNTPDKPNTMHRWFGEAVAAALATDRQKPGRGNRGIPQSIRAAALEILEAVRRREGLPLTRVSPNAYERCCEIFRDAGYPSISPYELERWRSEANKARE